MLYSTDPVQDAARHPLHADWQVSQPMPTPREVANLAALKQGNKVTQAAARQMRKKIQALREARKDANK